MAMSFLDSGSSGLPGEEVLVADGLNGLAVKMESPFRLFLQLAFRDPAAVLKEMLFGQSEAFIPDASRLAVTGTKPLEVRLRCPEGHFLPTKHGGSSFHQIMDKNSIAHMFYF